MEHVLDYDGEALEDLVVSLLTRDGKVHPLNIHSPGLGQGQEHRLDVRSSP